MPFHAKRRHKGKVKDRRHTPRRGMFSRLLRAEILEDRRMLATTLVSEADPRVGELGNNYSEFPWNIYPSNLSSLRTISGDGRYVFFNSFATNLVTGVAGGSFIKDLTTGGTSPAVSRFLDATISADGRYIAGTREISGITTIVVVQDLIAGEVDFPLFDTANGGSYGPSLSSDGRFMAFASEANNLVPGDANGLTDVFVVDLTTYSTTLVSTSSIDVQGNNDSLVAAISADGHFVAFASYATNFGSTSGGIYLKDLTTGATTLVSSSSTGVPAVDFGLDFSISYDGRYVAFTSPDANLVPGGVSNDAWHIYVKDMITGQTTWVSSNSTGTLADSDSYTPSISADGRYVAFVSDATNLVPDGDANGSLAFDIYLKDLSTGLTTRASANAAGGQGNQHSHSPSISGDGRYVTFQSFATNLAPGDSNGTSDIFRKDLLTQEVVVVSWSGSKNANGQSYVSDVERAVSANGRYVTFASNATNLTPTDRDSLYDIYVKDVSTGTTVMASSASDGVKGNADSRDPSISANGRYVAFNSAATNLVPGGDANGAAGDVYVKDLSTGEILRASTDSHNVQGNGHSGDASLSADGRYVTFHSQSTNLTPGDANGRRDVFVKDLSTGAIIRVSTTLSGAQANGDSDEPAISADGRFVSFTSEATNLVAGDTNGRRDIFVKDLVSNEIVRVTTDSAGVQANADSLHQSISANGRYVAFHSDATNLVPGDTNGQTDVFIKDRISGATMRVSVDSSGVQGNFRSLDPSISDDGRYVAFYSEATNLVSHDGNGVADIFVRDLVAGVTTRVREDEIYGDSFDPSISGNGRLVASYSRSPLTPEDRNGQIDVFLAGPLFANSPPLVAASQTSVAVNEGAAAANSGTFADDGADIVTLSASVGAVTKTGGNGWTWSYGTTDGPDQSQLVTITAVDADGATSTATFSLIVNNVAPTIAANQASVTVDEGATATNSGTFADAGADVVTLSASVGEVTDNGDGTWRWSYTVDGDSGQVVTITATDSDGLQSSTSFALLLPIVGDFDSDGVVAGGDLDVWRSGFGATTGASVETGDADGDRDVDGADFLLWQRNVGRSAGASLADNALAQAAIVAAGSARNSPATVAPDPPSDAHWLAFSTPATPAQRHSNTASRGDHIPQERFLQQSPMDWRQAPRQRRMVGDLCSTGETTQGAASMNDARDAALEDLESLNEHLTARVHAAVNRRL